MLEHFFNEAWRSHIEELLLEAKGDTHVASELLVEHQPRNEEDYLRLVLNFEPNHPLWQIVIEHKFCDNSVISLTKKIYKTRNELLMVRSFFGRFLRMVTQVVSLETKRSNNRPVS